MCSDVTSQRAGPGPACAARAKFAMFTCIYPINSQRLDFFNLVCQRGTIDYEELNAISLLG